MNVNTDSTSQFLPQFLMLFCIALGIFALFLFIRLRRLEQKWKVFIQDSSGGSLEHALQQHFEERRAMKKAMDELLDRIEVAEGKLQTSKRHLGIVRYDAFEGVGGAQSFSLALFDDRGDGAVITSQVGRNDCRVYCKPLVRGRAERTLSQEESRAMVDAYNESGRPIITP
jgi:hypothetical protein